MKIATIKYNPCPADRLTKDSHPTQFGALLMIMKHLGGDQWEKFE